MGAGDVGRIAERVDAALRENGSSGETFGGVVKLDFGDDGSMVIDGMSSPVRAFAGDAPAHCTLSLSVESFRQMVRGELDAAAAYFSGKVRITGDVRLAAQLGPLLKKARQTHARPASP